MGNKRNEGESGELSGALGNWGFSLQAGPIGGVYWGNPSS